MSDPLPRVREALARQARIPLAHLPTPIHDAVRLRQALGGPARCPRILVKRDDLTALGLGGNKARKLEFLVADALAKGAATLITTAAAAAGGAGRRCGLVLTSTSDDPPVAGNLLLDRLFGADVRLVPSADPMLAVGQDEAVVAEVAAAEQAAGRVPYVIPVGGSSGIGVFGYVSGSAELVEQLGEMGVEPSRLYYASGSRGTQAGLTLGAKACGAPYRVYGVAVSAGEPEKIERARRIANEAASLLGLEERLDLGDLFTDQGFIGEGYGIPTPQGLEAIAVLARTEAILLDPCYTSKAMAALVHHARAGELAPGETVVFLHTGGMPALFTEGFASAFPLQSSTGTAG